MQWYLIFISYPTVLYATWTIKNADLFALLLYLKGQSFQRDPMFVFDAGIGNSYSAHSDPYIADYH